MISAGSITVKITGIFHHIILNIIWKYWVNWFTQGLEIRFYEWGPEVPFQLQEFIISCCTIIFFCMLIYHCIKEYTDQIWSPKPPGNTFKTTTFYIGTNCAFLYTMSMRRRSYSYCQPVVHFILMLYFTLYNGILLKKGFTANASELSTGLSQSIIKKCWKSLIKQTA